MQVIGNYLDEGTLLAIGHHFQEVTDWHLHAPGEVA
jgi:aspartyl-tRNA(Asn)/glutamyl-tRNA(Gln) amidotransferase subunit A